MPDPLAKRLELAVRRRIIAAVVRLARRPRRGGTLELPANPRILLLRHDRLGDAVISTPFFKHLRTRYPSARIDVLLGRRNHAVASLLPAVDDTLVLMPGLRGLRSIRTALRARRYDVVVNLLANDSSSGAILTIAAGARFRVGFGGSLADIYDFAVPRPDARMHIVRETSQLLSAFGIEPIGETPRGADDSTELVLGSAPSRSRDPLPDPPRIVFSISAPSEARSWRDENVVELARRMRSLGIPLAIAATPADRERLEAIVDASGAEKIEPSTSLREFVRNLAHADIVITPQTSTVHIASALARPTVLLNTDSESDRQWTPWGVRHRIVSRGERIDAIAVDDVLHAVSSLVEELRASRP